MNKFLSLRELTDIREHDKKISDEAHDTHQDVNIYNFFS